MTELRTDVGDMIFRNLLVRHIHLEAVRKVSQCAMFWCNVQLLTTEHHFYSCCFFSLNLKETTSLLEWLGYEVVGLTGC